MVSPTLTFAVAVLSMLMSCGGMTTGVVTLAVWLLTLASSGLPAPLSTGAVLVTEFLLIALSTFAAPVTTGVCAPCARTGAHEQVTVCPAPWQLVQLPAPVTDTDEVS